MHVRSRMGRALTAVAAVAIPMALVVPTEAGAGGPKSSGLIPTGPVTKHLNAFQRIADQNGGTRAAGSPGHDASAAYVADKLTRAGYKVTLQEFEFDFFEEHSNAVMEQISPTPTVYAPTPPDGSSVGDFATMDFSATGDVEAAVVPIDVVVPIGSNAPNTSTSGCEEADFAGQAPGFIALMQRGTCPFGVKAANAEAAGAVGAIIFNEGQPDATPDRFGVILGTLGAPVGIPVVGTSYTIGVSLVEAIDPVVHLATDTTSETRTTRNVIADSKWGDPNNVVMIGAHLDSVPAGPGINDNGSGSAAILFVAETLGKIPTKNKLRFAFWSAEEQNLIGSTEYVGSLLDGAPDELAKIRLYLNFDMIASPNYALHIYDGDDSDAEGAPAGPPGSDEIEKMFERYYDFLRQPYIGTDFDGRSDYGPFIEVGIPSGGLFTGAEDIKTAEQAALFGGTAGIAFDPCYHQACDTIANINHKALALNTGAIAVAALQFAFSRDLPGPDTAAAPTGARIAQFDSGVDVAGRSTI